MHRRRSFTLCLLLINFLAIFGQYSGPQFYLKKGNAYHRSLECEKEKPVAKPGFLEMNKKFIDYNKGKVGAEVFKKFDYGLEEYFLLKSYEEQDNDRIKNDLVPVPDPIPLPEVGYYGIAFHKVQVSGYSPYKHRLDLAYYGMNSPYQYMTSVSANSDTVIFKGHFTVNNASYNFAYNLKTVSYKSKVHWIRGYEKPISVKVDLNFGHENITHTYDSSFKNYAQVNELVEENLILALESVYLPNLDEYSNDEYYFTLAVKDLHHITSYRRLIKEVLIESAIRHLKVKGLTSFEVTPLNKISAQTYTNIKLQNVLNFYKKDSINSTIEVDGDTKAKLSEGVEFHYAEDANNPTLIEFIIADGIHQVPKMFKIKSIKVIAIYNASMNETAVKVHRDKFLIKFDFYDCCNSSAYELLFRHIGNVISRVIENELGAQEVRLYS